MKLYYSKGACSLTVRIIIHELNLNAEYEAVNLKTKQTEKGEDYFKINPKGAVPVIIDNAEIITENSAILQYLADKYNATELLPAVNTLNRTRVIEWLNFVATDLHKGFSPLFNSAIPKELKESIFIPNLKNKFNFVEKCLATNKYLLGENFTLPDAYLFVILRWCNSMGLIISQWPSIEAYFERLKNRKSIQASLKEEGL